MKPLLDEIVGVLDRETELVRELVGELQRDQHRIIQQDIAGLEQSNTAKQERVLRFQALEVTRERLTAQLGAALGLRPDEVRVSRIVPLLGPDAAPLEAAADKLRAVVASLRELLAVSRGFLEQSILGIRGLLSLLESLRTPDPGTYDATGRHPRPVDAAPVAVRREV